jgi:acetyl esterase/lipase
MMVITCEFPLKYEEVKDMSFEQRLDPELRVAVAKMPDISDITVDVPTHRQELLEMMAAFSPPPLKNVTMEDRHIPGPAGAPEVFVRVYSPEKRTESLPGVMWIHGGAFLFGHPSADDGICQRFVDQVECVVVSVDWRLAPENPFPAGVEDCYAALQWIVASAAELGIDPDRVAVAGGSAGGGVTAGLALLARDRGGPKLAFHMPLFACLDDRHMTPSSHEITYPKVFNRDVSLKAWKLYLGSNQQGEVSPYATPARAKDLSGLPPTYMYVGELDLLRDENIEYATRLLQAGVSTEFHVYPGAFHGFEGAVPSAALSQRATSGYINALKRALHY